MRSPLTVHEYGARRGQQHREDQEDMEGPVCTPGEKKKKKHEEEEKKKKEIPDRVTLKKEIGLLSACTIIIGCIVRQRNIVCWSRTDSRPLQTHLRSVNASEGASVHMKLQEVMEKGLASVHMNLQEVMEKGLASVHMNLQEVMEKGLASVHMNLQEVKEKGLASVHMNLQEVMEKGLASVHMNLQEVMEKGLASVHMNLQEVMEKGLASVHMNLQEVKEKGLASVHMNLQEVMEKGLASVHMNLQEVKEKGLASVHMNLQEVMEKGNIIGSGIFISPKGVLEHSGSVGVALVVWVMGGCIAALGSLCYAELGVTIPKSGGDYSYVTEIFGGLMGFLLLWSAVLIMYPTTLAVIALTFSNYVLQPVFPDCVPPYMATRMLSAACLRKCTPEATHILFLF
ncbi:hypothetical protein JOQ06_027798 [Pogonophryne albipinna]|uniref:Uncharacterized protein n=1 Tax=Pogonophryne albipinna TaxID=1090488 RepID=A0AAD6F2C8_9TELE|nr:hypothetical protein JOQ06_027798 [Pogonophryne albipinna]